MKIIIKRYPENQFPWRLYYVENGKGRHLCGYRTYQGAKVGRSDYLRFWSDRELRARISVGGQYLEPHLHVIDL